MRALLRHSSSPSASLLFFSNTQRYLAHVFTSHDVSSLHFGKKVSPSAHSQLYPCPQNHPLKCYKSVAMKGYHGTLAFGFQQCNAQNCGQNLFLYTNPRSTLCLSSNSWIAGYLVKGTLSFASTKLMSYFFLTCSLTAESIDDHKRLQASYGTIASDCFISALCLIFMAVHHSRSTCRLLARRVVRDVAACMVCRSINPRSGKILVPG